MAFLDWVAALPDKWFARAVYGLLGLTALFSVFATVAAVAGAVVASRLILGAF